MGRRFILYLLSALFWLRLIAAASSCLAPPRGKLSLGCSKLATAYPCQTFFPGSTEYTNETDVVWSQTCLQSPYCVFEPESAQDVAAALKIMQATQTKFAVRSGGHMPVPGAAAITNGVLFSLNRLNETTLIDEKTARIGTGLRWSTVYEWISSYGLGIAGGRFGPVGVGGLLLGGGINYFGSQVGWSASTVSNYEVVLANGTVLNANAHSHRDLWWALKGGSSNFGIVTRVEMDTFPLTDVFGGTMIYSATNLDEYIHAIAGFVDPAGGSADVLSMADPLMLMLPSTGQIEPAAVLFHRGSDPDPESLQNFTTIPALSDTTGLRPNFTSFVNEQDTSAYSDTSSRQLFYTTSLKASPDSVYLVNNTFIDAAMDQLSEIPGLLTSVTYQTMTADFVTAARAAGGDAIDLDPANGGFIDLLVSTSWSNASDDQTVIEFSTNILAEIDAKADAANLSFPFIYLNDAGATERPFKHYGGGASLSKMKAISKAYDPLGVFQKLLPGGFKLEI